MKHLKSLGRASLLIVLFAIGVGLVWYIGRNLLPQKHDPIPQPPPVSSRPAEPQQVFDRKETETKVIRPAISVGILPRIVHTDRGRFIATDPILFNSGLTTLRDASMPKLDRIAEFLIRNPDIAIEIVGHTDNLGPEPVNQKVSAERAAIVMNYLISQGIDPSRLQSKGMGSLDPIDSNDTQLGRQANRRIEFLIKEGAAEHRQ